MRLTGASGWPASSISVSLPAGCSQMTVSPFQSLGMSKAYGMADWSRAGAAALAAGGALGGALAAGLPMTLEVPGSGRVRQAVSIRDEGSFPFLIPSSVT